MRNRFSIFLLSIQLTLSMGLNVYAGGEQSRDQPVDLHYRMGGGGGGGYNAPVQHPGAPQQTPGGYDPGYLNQRIPRTVAVSAPQQPKPSAPTPGAPQKPAQEEVQNHNPIEGLDSQEIPNRHDFESSGDFRNDLIKIQDRLDQANPQEEKRIFAKSLGNEAVREADQSFVDGKTQDADFWKNIATEFADIAVGIDPVSGFGRGAYEVTSGKNLITGETLNTFERGLAFAAVVSGGGSSTVIKASNALIRLGAKAAPSALSKIIKAVDTGRKILEKGNLQHALKYREYARDIEKITGTSIPRKQRNLLKKALQEKNFTPLNRTETRAHRRIFNSKKDSLIEKWQNKTKKTWPTYEKEIIGSNGNKIRAQGDRYDAHHIIESKYGGPNEWWNIHPARFPTEHQAGIHRAGGVGREIFK